jgi:hypothetical protein
MEQLIILHSDISIEEASAVLPFISESFLISMITDAWPERTGDFYTVNFRVPADLYEEWIEHNGAIKVYSADNFKGITNNIERLGLTSRVDYFPIRANKELRGIGFKPMSMEIVNEILKDAPVQFLSSFARK